MVNVAITDFLLSLPLAIRAENGLFFCHSIPNDDQLETFDFTVFDRQLKAEDYKRRVGPVYQLIWGRNVTPAGATLFAESSRQDADHRASAAGIRLRHQWRASPDHRIGSQPGRLFADRSERNRTTSRHWSDVFKVRCTRAGSRG